MEGIVELLGHLEKLLVTLYDIPAGINAQLLQQRHHAAQNLSNSSPAESGVDILDNLAR